MDQKELKQKLEEAEGFLRKLESGDGTQRQIDQQAQVVIDLRAQVKKPEKK